MREKERERKGKREGGLWIHRRRWRERHKTQRQVRERKQREEKSKWKKKKGVPRRPWHSVPCLAASAPGAMAMLTVRLHLEEPVHQQPLAPLLMEEAPLHTNQPPPTAGQPCSQRSTLNQPGNKITPHTQTTHQALAHAHTLSLYLSIVHFLPPELLTVPYPPRPPALFGILLQQGWKFRTHAVECLPKASTIGQELMHSTRL